ncbi:MAG: hypothetical protein ACT4NU_05535 [Chromatiales bacterium]
MMALSADTRPHFTTIADFISFCTEEVTALFATCCSAGVARWSSGARSTRPRRAAEFDDTALMKVFGGAT